MTGEPIKLLLDEQYLGGMVIVLSPSNIIGRENGKR